MKRGSFLPTWVTSVVTFGPSRFIFWNPKDKWNNNPILPQYVPKNSFTVWESFSSAHSFENFAVSSS